MTENGKEKKTTRTRRSPAGEKNRQQDQVLSGATDAPKIGKIAGPKKTAAKKTTERTAQRGRGKAESKKTETKKSETKKPETKKTAEKAASTGKKKTETSRKAPARGSRKPQKPAISQTAAQLEAIRAQQEAQEKRTTRKGRGGRSQKSKKPPIKVYFLGGLNEIGKNFTLYECQGDMVIVDCGLSFPDEDMPGVDSVIPDFAFVEKNRERIRGVVITHGHEDHIGAVPYLLKKLNVPVYGTAPDHRPDRMQAERAQFELCQPPRHPRRVPYPAGLHGCGADPCEPLGSGRGGPGHPQPGRYRGPYRRL